MHLGPVQAGQGEGKAIGSRELCRGWLLAPFIADMVKKAEQAFVAGSVEAILTLFFLSVTGLRPVDPENPVRV